MRRLARVCAAALALAALATAVFGAAPATAATEPALPSGFHDEVALELGEPGFEQPTNFRFAPDGRTFVALKGGKIVVFPKGSAPNATPEVFANLAKQVYDNGDHGLLGLALDPKFDQGRPYVYALYTFNHVLGAPAGEMPKWPSSTTVGSSAFEGDECPLAENECLVSGRLVRLTAEGNHAKPSAGAPEETVLLEDWCEQSTTHSIGDLQFGPEGALFASGGEGAIFTTSDYGQFNNLCGDPEGEKGVPLSGEDAEGGSLRSQSIFRPNGQVTLDGTLVRIDPETGEGWPGNPMGSSSNANARRIVGVGFRNPFRFTVNARLGDLFVNNVGNGEDEEIDRFPVGSSQIYNSGWPCYEGLGPNYQFEVLGLRACKRLYETPGSTSPPFFYYKHGTPITPGDTCPSYNGSAISGSAFYEGSTYPAEYDDALFFADSVRGCIYAMLADDGEPDPLSVVPFLSEGENYPGVDLEAGPEGSIYYDNLYESTINRIAFDPEAPTARLKADKESGPLNLTVHFDAGESTAPPGDELRYEWDLDGNGTFASPTSSDTATETYEAATNVTAAVRVRDLSTGKSAVAQLKIYPGDTPPKVEITKPESSETWGVGQTIEFLGAAWAEEGNGAPIPLENLYWKARLLHCPFGPTNCHEHPIQVFPGVNSGELRAPDHDYPSYIRLFLSATDARGLRSEASVKLDARPVPLQLRSEPPGIAILAGTKTLTTPAELLAIEDSPTTIAAPETAVVDGLTYTFDRWSDGGARVHTVPAEGPATYTAVYGAALAPPPSGGGGGNGGSKPSPPPSASPKIDKRPRKTTTSPTARFVFSGEPGQSYRCKLDRKPVASCRSPRVYKDLKPGKHSFRVYAVDSAGNRLTKATLFEWRIVAAHRAGTRRAWERLRG